MEKNEKDNEGNVIIPVNGNCILPFVNTKGKEGRVVLMARATAERLGSLCVFCRIPTDRVIAFRVPSIEIKTNWVPVCDCCFEGIIKLPHTNTGV